MSNNTIYISAGHSDTDPGAVATHDGVEYHEETLVTNFRNKLAEYIKSKGNITVLTDGTSGVNKDRNIAISEAKKVNGPRIDIHMNASENNTAHGTEVISNPTKKKVAQDIAKIIADSLGNRLRGSNGWIDQSQSKRGKLAWINSLDGILIELCFISNKTELQRFFQNEDKLVKTLGDYLYNYTMK
jgi:N-acetylmuramoyl-L-alanine amidase